MYTGNGNEQKRTRRHRRRKWNILGIILDCVLILLCMLIIGKAIVAVEGLFAPEVPSFSYPSESPSTASCESRDADPPVISGVQDMTVYQGNTVAYRSGVSVTDGEDPAPLLEVDSSSVDLMAPGSYEVIYTATDAAGNTATARATVTVLPKQEGFVELETILAAAQEVLDRILWPEATAREQVIAIYSWARTNIAYSGHSDRTDYRQTAYTVLQEKQGDCYGYFAVTKLLFEQLGIPNLDVTKVKNSETDSEHFWSLVSIDGGENYYHFDATPRIGEGDDFCLVTDAFLDAYSQSHKNCHNRDMSLYPATPEEDLP